MYTKQTDQASLNGFSRCEDQSQAMNPKNSLNQNQNTDRNLEAAVADALWKDDVLRAIEQGQVEVRVQAGDVHLSGHIVNTANMNRIISALLIVPGVGIVHNHLVLDDTLTLEVAGALGALEHTYACKFFTGAAHGVLSLNGDVESETVKSMAEQCAADNPHVRGVVSRIRVKGSGTGAPEAPFLQPAPGATIYFLDGISGPVQQVIIDPHTRRVIAMTLLGSFNAQPIVSPRFPKPYEEVIVVPIKTVRHLTKASGFLNITSQESNEYLNFDPAHFRSPEPDWIPPHPYCPAQVLLTEDRQIVHRMPRPVEAISKEQILWEQLLANDSLGG